MRIQSVFAGLLLLAFAGPQALAQQLQFPIFLPDAKIEEFQPGNRMRSPDIYRLANSDYKIEFQCGRDRIVLSEKRSQVNCSLAVTDLRSQVTEVYGISDFYQEGIEKLFQDHKAGDTLEGFYFEGPWSEHGGVLLMSRGKTRAYKPAGNPGGTFEKGEPLKPGAHIPRRKFRAGDSRVVAPSITAVR
jgi:hypothetical protein